MSDDRTVRTILQRITAIEANFGRYNKLRLDYSKRGSLPTNSMPDHVSGSSEPPMPELDALDVRVDQGWRQIRASLAILLLETARIESNMAFVVNTTKRPTDPEPRACANQRCPDSRIFSMVGRDRPQDSHGRCDACRKFYGRNARERTSMTAYSLDSTDTMVGAATLERPAP